MSHQSSEPADATFSLATFNASPTSATTWRMLALTDADGIVGWGEFTLNVDPASIAARVEAVQAEVARDGNATTLRELADRLVNEDRISAALASAFDQALADHAARREGVTLAGWLGAPVPTPPVSLYANINRGTRDRTPDGFAARALEAVSDGHAAVKIAPFDDVTPDIADSARGRALADAGLARIQAVSDAVGNSVTVMVDCHWRFSETAAMAVLPALEQAGVGWFECPIPELPDAPEALRRIRSAANQRGMRTAGCETMTGWQQFAPWVECGAYDVIMPDIKYVGGYERLRDIVERCAGHGVTVSLHNPSGPIAHAASLHVTAALCPTERLEFQFAETPRFDELVNDRLPGRSNGVSPLPDGPGIGIVPDLRQMDDS